MNTKNQEESGVIFMLQFIKSYVEKEFQIKDLSTKNRSRSFVSARAVYYKLAKEETKLSLPIIGRSIRKTHATVLHGLKNVFPLLKTYDPSAYKIYEKYNKIKPTNKESEMFSLIDFEKLKVKYLNEKRDKYNIQRRLDRIQKVKEQSKLYDITDRFNNLSKNKQEVFLERVNAILNMM